MHIDIISEEDRDRLLDLCKASKEVSQEYDKAAEIIQDIDSLPSYLRNDFKYPELDKVSENLHEKLCNISDFINYELIEQKPDWYINIIKELDSLHSMSGDHFKDNISMINAIQNLKASYGRVFTNK